MNIIELIVKIWCEEYKIKKGTDYFAEKKDRKAVGLLLAKFKKKNPNKNTEDMIEMMRSYFKDVLQIMDGWYAINMSLPLLNSKINEINQHVAEIRRVRKQHKFHDNIGENLKKLETSPEAKQIFEKWKPKSKGYRKPQLTRVQFLREYGAARINEYEDYKKGVKK